MNSIDLLSVMLIPKSPLPSDTIRVRIGDLVVLDGVDGVLMMTQRGDSCPLCTGCDLAVGHWCRNSHFRCSGVNILKRVAVD